MLASPTAESVSYQQDGSRLAACRIKNWISGYKQPGPTVNGSGTLTVIDGEAGLVLTAAHLFEGRSWSDHRRFSRWPELRCPNPGDRRKLDVAALWIYAPKGIQPVPIADQSPGRRRSGRDLGLRTEAVPRLFGRDFPDRFPWKATCPVADCRSGRQGTPGDHSRRQRWPDDLLTASSWPCTGATVAAKKILAAAFTPWAATRCAIGSKIGSRPPCGLEFWPTRLATCR